MKNVGSKRASASTTRDWSIYRDPAVLLVDQLKHVYVDGELELIDTPQYFPKIQRKDYSVALRARPERC